MEQASVVQSDTIQDQNVLGFNLGVEPDFTGLVLLQDRHNDNSQHLGWHFDICVRLFHDFEVTNDLFITFWRYFQNISVILFDYIFSLKKDTRTAEKTLLVLSGERLDFFTHPLPTFTRKYEHTCVNFEPWESLCTSSERCRMISAK